MKYSVEIVNSEQAEHNNKKPVSLDYIQIER